MNEEKMKILQLLEEGKITAIEASKLMPYAIDAEPKGIGYWIKFTVSTLILISFGYLIFYYLPINTGHETMMLIYGLLGGFVFLVAIVAVIVGTVVGSKAMSVGKVMFQNRNAEGKKEKE